MQDLFYGRSFSFFGKAKANREAEEKSTKHELEVWQSEGRKLINADKEAADREYERVQLEESKLKSEQFRVVSSKLAALILFNFTSRFAFEPIQD